MLAVRMIRVAVCLRIYLHVCPSKAIVYIFCGEYFVCSIPGLSFWISLFPDSNTTLRWWFSWHRSSRWQLTTDFISRWRANCFQWVYRCYCERWDESEVSGEGVRNCWFFFSLVSCHKDILMKVDWQIELRASILVGEIVEVLKEHVHHTLI